MAFLEWRKFHFFDLRRNVDHDKINQILPEDGKITATSTGNNQLVLGDSTGQIHLVNRSWHIKTFRGYEMTVELLNQMRNLPLLVTIGQDEPGINPLVKVWDTSRFDKNGIPYCSRIFRAVPGNRAVNASALCVHDGLQMMAVGFSDGSLVLYRGDITRDRSAKSKLLRDASSAVTGLAFKTTSSSVFLFLATDSSIIMYNISQKDKESKFQLDNIGCGKNCSVLVESMPETHFMVARDDAIYCYTTDGRGPCYAIEGTKTILDWFRTYLVIVSKKTTKTSLDDQSNASSSATENGLNESDTITVLDIHNKFIVFSTTLNTSIRAVLNEWGAFYILDSENRIHHLDEKDLQSKLTLLFKKNLYDVAIRIAKSQQYDSEGLVDIFKQYGDHLCDKGDHVGAIEQYIRTIGKLEPSYVIRKFIESQHIEKLTMYLEALHKQKHATEDHTTLLLNCYTKMENIHSDQDGGLGGNLKQFISPLRDTDLNYDVDVAIKICRRCQPNEALLLAKKHEKHDWYIKLQIEDHGRYGDVLSYIESNLKFDDADFYMKKYGHILIQNEPNASTEFLKRLCTNFSSDYQADPEEYIHLFLNRSENLVDFLEFLIAEGSILSTPVYNTLLEHYLHLWSLNKQPQCSNKILKLLHSNDIKYDKNQALVLCHMNSFSEGILYLYEEQKLYQQILRYHIKNCGSDQAIINCCRRFGHQEPNLWVQALWSCLNSSGGGAKPSVELMSEILDVISKEKLLAPQLVLDTLCTSPNNIITLGHLRKYVTQHLTEDKRRAADIATLIKKYQSDTEQLKEKLETLKSGSVVIQGSRCAACHHPLELPTVHFLCQHSYHQHCFQSFSEDENECPACRPENKNLLELLQAREYNKDLHETFHSQLEKASDGFSIAAEYFGRGVFNQLYNNYKLVEKTAPSVMGTTVSSTCDKKYATSVINNNYGPGAEGRMRKSEVRSIAVANPTSEGRVRLQESRHHPQIHTYSSSLEANIIKTSSASPVAKSVTVKSREVAKSSNPFEDEYDEAKNPFSDGDAGKSSSFVDDDLDPNNPFGDDCDKNLNPFYE